MADRLLIMELALYLIALSMIIISLFTHDISIVIGAVFMFCVGVWISNRRLYRDMQEIADTMGIYHNSYMDLVNRIKDKDYK